MAPRSQARSINTAKLRSAGIASRRAIPARNVDRSEAQPRRMGEIARRIAYLGFALALAFGAQRLLTDPFFQVAQVEVRGARYLTRSTVIQAADVLGTNIFQISAEATRARVMSTGVPEDVMVYLVLPSTVTIVVDERPTAFLWKSGSSTYAVSDDGTALGLATTDHPSVVVVDLDARPVDAGKPVDVRFLREATYVVRTIPTVAGFIPGSIDVSASLGVSVVTPDGFTVAIGDDTDLPGKLESLGPALFAARQTRPLPTTIDLRFVGHPVFR